MSFEEFKKKIAEGWDYEEIYELNKWALNQHMAGRLRNEYDKWYAKLHTIEDLDFMHTVIEGENDYYGIREI